MLAGVVQALLHDAVGGEPEARRQLDVGAREHEVHVEAGSPLLVDQGDEVTGVGLGLERPRSGTAVLAAQHPDEVAHLHHRLLAHVLDGPQRLLRLRRVRLGEVLAHRRLHADHADGMTHQVVQLAGDAGPLAGGRGLGPHLGPLGAPGQLLLSDAALADELPDEPGAPEQRHLEQPVANERDRLVGVEALSHRRPERGHHRDHRAAEAALPRRAPRRQGVDAQQGGHQQGRAVGLVAEHDRPVHHRGDQGARQRLAPPEQHGHHPEHERERSHRRGVDESARLPGAAAAEIGDGGEPEGEQQHHRHRVGHHRRHTPRNAEPLVHGGRA